MPSDYSVGLDDHQQGTPACPEPRQPYPEDAVAHPQPWAFLLFAQHRQLLSKSEILGGQLGLAAKHCPEKNEDDPYRTHTRLPNPPYLLIYM